MHVVCSTKAFLLDPKIDDFSLVEKSLDSEKKTRAFWRRIAQMIDELWQSF
jgi:hypothetical protein